MPQTSPDFWLAFAAGLLAFLSPCIVPLIPSYLSFLTGSSSKELQQGSASRFSSFVLTLFFVLGFSLVFTALSILFVLYALLLAPWQWLINLVFGVIILLLGLNMLFGFFDFLNYEKKFHVEKRSRKGVLSALLFGMAFGAGWTPCVGPMLASILALAGQTGNIPSAIVLLFAFSLGLAVPFLLFSVFAGSAMTTSRFFSRHSGIIRTISSVFLILLSPLVAFGGLKNASAAAAKFGFWLQDLLASNPVLPNSVAGALFLLFGVILFIRAVGRGKSTSLPMLLWALASIILGLLNLSGTLSVPWLFAQWLVFQGI